MQVNNHSGTVGAILTLVLLGVALFPAPDALAATQRNVTVDGDERSKVSPDGDNAAAAEAAIRAQISSVYQGFYNSYRLGAGDAVAIHIDKHPDDSLERAVVSPVGQVYYSLLGNVAVAGKTIPELQDYFTASISEYIKDPRVTVSLLEANSAKVGVLGDVRVPGVVILSRPMRVLDAITAVGGITDTGSKQVSILRQYPDGRIQTLSVNMKHILSGKGGPEENVFLNAGDTIVVHGNLVKKVQMLSSMMGIASFFAFLAR
jgi:polysaccharide export outer membrane protein